MQLVRYPGCTVLNFCGGDGTNRLTRERVGELTEAVNAASGPLVITGNQRFFSAGADLNDIRTLSGASAYDFARIGQQLMDSIDRHPALVVAAISGYCMGGGLDLALACAVRIAAPNAIFGHRGAALGIMTGWGGTQRLPRLIGKARALQMFVAAEKLHAKEALACGLIDAIAPDPLSKAIQRCGS